MTLGLQRLSYGFSKDNNIMLVLTLLLTHVIEGYLWWSMALAKSSLTPIILFIDAVKFKLGILLHILFLASLLTRFVGVDTFIVLIGVPLLVVLMTYLSIDSFVKKKKI